MALTAHRPHHGRTCRRIWLWQTDYLSADKSCSHNGLPLDELSTRYLPQFRELSSTSKISVWFSFGHYSSLRRDRDIVMAGLMSPFHPVTRLTARKLVKIKSRAQISM
ncbi:Uncharacterised protein r2_g314 [Pycnogonum litorale]